MVARVDVGVGTGITDAKRRTIFEEKTMQPKQQKYLLLRSK